jgi:hypothetical protein
MRKELSLSAAVGSEEESGGIPRGLSLSVGLACPIFVTPLNRSAPRFFLRAMRFSISQGRLRKAKVWSVKMRGHIYRLTIYIVRGKRRRDVTLARLNAVRGAWHCLGLQLAGRACGARRSRSA